MHIDIEGFSGWFVATIVTIVLMAILIIGLLGLLYYLTECAAWLLNRIKPNLETKRILTLWLLNRKKITKYIKEHESELENNPFKDKST
jgi:hypothetical protein